MAQTYDDILAMIESIVDGNGQVSTETPAPTEDKEAAAILEFESAAPTVRDLKEQAAAPATPVLFAEAEPEVEIAIPKRPTTNIMEKTICISMRIGRIGIKRKVNSERVEIKPEEGSGIAKDAADQLNLLEQQMPDATVAKTPKRAANDTDRKLLDVTKKLLDCAEYQDIVKMDGEVRRYLTGMSLPSPFRSGTYLLTMKAVGPVEEQLNKFAEERLKRIRKFRDAYPLRVQETALRLGPLFAASDYPPPERVERFFRFDWQYITFSTPDSLKEISGEIFNREREKAEQRWAEAEVKIQQVLRANMAELVEHLRERLSGGEDGKPKKFQSSTLTKVQEFLSTFSLRNATNDTELEALVKQAEGLLNGVDADMLRSDDKLREQVREGFASIEKTLDGMTTNKPQRMILLDEDEGEN